jgi:PAS domain S-box-containing protein
MKMKAKTRFGSTQSDTHHKHPTADLLVSEKCCAGYMDNIIDGVYCLNADGYFIFVNNVILKRSGISRDQFYTLHFLDVVDPEYHEQVKRNFQRVMKGQEGIPYELKYKSPNGQIKVVEVHSRPVYEGKKIVGLQGVSRDVTARKQAEAALLESEERFHKLADATFEGIVIHDKGEILDVNSTMLQMLGYDHDEFIGRKNIIDFIAPESREIALRYIMMGYEKPYELMMIKKNENTIIMEVSGKAISYKGKMARVVAHRDITDRKLAEERLRKSEEKYRAVLESASDAILIGDEHGNLLEANRKTEELFGYSRNELLQMHYTQLHPVMEQERTIAAYKDIVTHGKGDLQNGVILRKDGTAVPVDVTATAIEYDGRRVFQASFRDISEHKQTEDTLESMVQERTVELFEKNKQLLEVIKERKRAEAALQKKKKELMLHAGKLQEMNAALKVLLKQREEDKRELEEKVMANVKELLLPYLEELKTCRLDAKGRVHVSILEANLNSIISPFTHRLSSKYSGFTPREIQVANLIKQGKSTKDIAEIIGVSHGAINLYRNHIRNKLGIITKKINLRSHLISLS